MGVVYLEYVLFIIIGIIQLVFFLKTQKKIKEYQVAVPEIKDIDLLEYALSDAQVENYITTGMLSFEHDVTDKEYMDEEMVDDSGSGNDLFYNAGKRKPSSSEKKHQIRLVGTVNNTPAVFSEIQFSINKYLLRNKHAPADFNLIKDIVERNTDSLEEDINLTISTPLYLGLMGTMLGIVIGLYSMSSINNAGSGVIGDNVSILLGSVKVAMIASFFGLFLTIYNSAIILKGTKYELETKKNRFYTFIQVELLPSLNQGIGSTFEALQRNLSKFNEKFDGNLDRLSSVFDKNYESILLQKELLKQLDRSKVSEITKYNVQVLKELTRALVEFDKFNLMFENLNSYLGNSYLLTDKTNELLERTGNFEVIAKAISTNISQSNDLINFLTNHFETLDNHKQKVNEAVASVSFGIKDTFDELRNAIKDISDNVSVEATIRSEESQKVFESFTTELKNTLEDQTKLFGVAIEEKKSNLDYLRHLEPLLAEVKSNNSLIQDQMAKLEWFNASADESSDNGKLYSEFVVLTSLVSGTNNTLKNIEDDLKTPFFKKYFRQKKVSNEEG
jgi:hypothetical protein